MAAKIKGLQQWCQRMTDGYPNVNITNFTTSWKNGLAFCAIIHRFRPDLIDFDSLSPDDVYENNKMAFEVGESELNIPAFLEADDMARIKVPDKLSVITYVSQYYNYLNALPQLGGPGVKGTSKKGSVAGNKRPPDISKVSSEPSIKKTMPSKTETKNTTNSTSSSPRKGTLGDKCAMCHNKVYLLERHIEVGKLYHRSCFGHSELSPTNKVLTKSPYMSPTLHNEKVNIDHKSSIRGTSSNVKNYQDQKTPVGKSHIGRSDSPVSSNHAHGSGNENSLLANVRSGLRRVEGGGTGSKEDDAKKAKVQPKSLFGGGKENLKASDKKPEENNAFPLSGKEAKKLEKRRQELLNAESTTSVNRTAKRGVPLVFQNKDKEPSPHPASSSVSIPSSSNLSTTKDVTSKYDKTNSKPSMVQGLQQQFNTPQTVSSEKKPDPTPTPQPVARARVPGAKIASSPFMNASNVDPDPKINTTDTKVQLRSTKETKDINTPKAAPRKSLVLQMDSNQQLPDSLVLTPESSSSDNTPSATPRSTRCLPQSSSSSSASSPRAPALPLTPPPSLPKSKPPSLPSTPPPDTSAATPSSSYHSTTNLPLSDTSHTSTSSIQVTTNKKGPDKRKDGFDKSTPLSSATSSSTSQSYVTASSKTPVSSNHSSLSESTSSLATPTDKPKQKEGGVLSGLLASLAGVRGRSASTPTNSIETSQLNKLQDISSNNQALTKTSTNSTSSPLSNRKHSEPGIKLPFGNTSTPKSSKSTLSAIDSKYTTGSSKHSEAGAKLSHANISIPKSAGAHKELATKTVEKNSHTSKTDHNPSSNTSTSRQTPINNAAKAKSTFDLLKPSSIGNAKSTTKVYNSKSEDMFKKPLVSVSDTKNVNKSHMQSSNVSDLNAHRHTPTTKLDNSMEAKSKPEHETFRDVQLKHVETKDNTRNSPRENNDVINDSKSKDTTTPKAVDSRSKDKTADSISSSLLVSDDDIPQWRKNLEERKERKKQLKDNNNLSDNTSSKLTTDKREKQVPKQIVNPMPKENTQKDSPRKDTTDSKVVGGKLNWQLEAERRMAAFADFDSEDDSKSIDGDLSEDVKVEEKLLELKKSKDRVKDSTTDKSDKKVKLKDSSNDVKVRGKQTILKTVDIDINGDSASDTRNQVSNFTNKIELSKPLPVNNFNNSNNTVSTVTKDKEKKSPRPGTLDVNHDDKTKQASPNGKKKISLLGKEKEKEIQLPSPTVPEKKKIGIVGKFDFDDDSASDFESSLILSTRQMKVNDDKDTTPQRPPRTNSQRSKAASPRQISAIELQQQLMEIDNRLTDLELRGRDLEDSIRNASFQEGLEVIDGDEEDEDRLMIEWFQLVSEKNDLVRQEADLVYLSREQELEDDQEHIEHQLHYLISKDDAAKSPQEKEEETYLIQRKIDIVNSRNCIIESMDEDRLRYEEEDKGIAHVLKNKGLWKDNGTLKAEKGKKVANSMFYA